MLHSCEGCAAVTSKKGMAISVDDFKATASSLVSALLSGDGSTTARTANYELGKEVDKDMFSAHHGSFAHHVTNPRPQ